MSLAQSRLRPSPPLATSAKGCKGRNEIMKDDCWRTAKMLVNGITVAYEDVGEGDNVLVLVHGHPFNRTMWQPQMEWIRRTNRARASAKPTARQAGARARSEGEGSLAASEWLGDDIGIEPATPQNLEHEDEDEHEHEGDGTWRAIAPDMRGYGQST